jgi:holo-[acyl-carrier protein] synthase
MSGSTTATMDVKGDRPPGATALDATYDERPGAPPLRVGVDLVAVADVVASVARFGDRYVRRIFTPHEIACCRAADDSPGAPPRYSHQSLAARFAAKEAVVKVLRPVGPRPAWDTIEVHRAEGGWCEIQLTGRAATLAAEAGIDEWAVSLTHEPPLAAAVVVGASRHRAADVRRPAGGRGEE